MGKLYYHWKHKPCQDLVDTIKSKRLKVELLEVSQLPSNPEYLTGVPTYVTDDDYMYTGTGAIEFVSQMEGPPPTPPSNSPVKEKINMQDCKAFLAQRDADMPSQTEQN